MSNPNSDGAKTAKKHFRKKLLIYPKFQLRILAINAGISLLTFGFVAFQTSMAFRKLNDLGEKVHLPADHVYFKFLELQAHDLYGHLAIAAAVGIVLLLGLVNMMRGGSPNRSQKLMRLRVLLQFVAIIVIMAAIWIVRG
jgi:hypothetical protein